MCGRYFLTTTGEEIRQLLGCVNSMEWQPRFNIAPSQTVPMVIPQAEPEVKDENQNRYLKTARWGLIPFWAKDERIGQRLINARAETLLERPAFRPALRHRRCLIPASGFYEWHRNGRGKQPYAVVRQDGGLMAFAGLWESWRQPGKATSLISCTIITCEANRTVRVLHRRMPAILEEKDWSCWLGSSIPAPDTLLRPCPDDWLRFYPVSSYVNDPRHDDPRCLTPLNRTESLFD